jgi:hypothetical protein
VTKEEISGLFRPHSLPEEFENNFGKHRDWKTRLDVSRGLGLGFAAPGGNFSRALYEAVMGGLASEIKSALEGQRVVELGAGMMAYGYALAASSGARNYLAVEPFYADAQSTSILEKNRDRKELLPRIPFKVVSNDMLEHLQSEGDDLISIIACGIENCILPDEKYKRKVEAEITRTLHPEGVFISSHSDIDPQGLQVTEKWFRRVENPAVQDRIRMYRKP